MTGLSTRFNIVNGKFQLTSGANKAADRVWFLMQFDRLRVLIPDFEPGLMSLVQKPASFMLQYKTLILSGITKRAALYVPEVIIEGAELTVSASDRKTYDLIILHKHVPTGSRGITVTFVG